MIAFVNALQPKTPQGTPVVEQVGFIDGCSIGAHTPWGTMGVSVRQCKRGLVLSRVIAPKTLWITLESQSPDAGIYF